MRNACDNWDMSVNSPEDFVASVDESVARNIKHARERAGYSQAAIAKLMTDAGVPGIHQTTIARIEGGERTLRLAEALVIARILDYRVEELVESTKSSILRERYDGLRKSVERARRAAWELLHLKRMLSDDLDREFPWSNGDASVTAEYIKVNPATYELLDELLSTNSDLSVIADGAYDRVREDLLQGPFPTPFVWSRSMELLSEASYHSWRAPVVRDLSEASDSEFQATIERFDELSYGEHQEAP